MLAALDPAVGDAGDTGLASDAREAEAEAALGLGGGAADAGPTGDAREAEAEAEQGLSALCNWVFSDPASFGMVSEARGVEGGQVDPPPGSEAWGGLGAGELGHQVTMHHTLGERDGEEGEEGLEEMLVRVLAEAREAEGGQADSLPGSEARGELGAGELGHQGVQHRLPGEVGGGGDEGVMRGGAGLRACSVRLDRLPVRVKRCSVNLSTARMPGMLGTRTLAAQATALGTPLLGKGRSYRVTARAPAGPPGVSSMQYLWLTCY